jgi:hypothetical protein
VLAKKVCEIDFEKFTCVRMQTLIKRLVHLFHDEFELIKSEVKAFASILYLKVFDLPRYYKQRKFLNQKKSHVKIILLNQKQLTASL